MANYIEFTHINAPVELKQQFITEAHGMNLGHIITNSKKTIKLSFHSSTTYSNIYLVMIVGMNDNVLIKLANQCGFPRGFPVLWIPTISMQYFGFYPKFSNDERQTCDDLSQINNVKKIDFFRKWSGFLAQVIAFEINGQVHWTVTSKNSADCKSPFVLDAKRLFEPFITNDVINLMIQQKLHFCAEIMSKNDQVHGSRVLIESPVITSVGSGKFFNVGMADVGKDKFFVNFFTNDELVKFCSENNLPCDSAITINNTQVSRKFLIELSEHRDFMTDDKLQSLLDKFATDVTFCSGTVKHSEILGDCLEGLVIQMHKTNGTVDVKKYKFANYTIRTMLLREQFKKFSFDCELFNKIKQFVDFWCVTAKGREYWTNFALECFMEYQSYQTTDSQIGAHILIAEMIAGQSNNFSNTLINFNHKIALRSLNTVVICIGPIGSGKTTFANKLATTNTNFIVIEGDTLDLGMDITMKLGAERNDYTRSKIIEALMLGKIPVISCGGGVLFSTGKNQTFNLPQQILSTLKIQCKVIVCIPSINCSKITQCNSTYDVSALYQMDDFVKNAVIRRVKAGEWTLDASTTGNVPLQKAINDFAVTIAKKSQANVKFAQQLVLLANHIYTYPLITNDNYGIQDTFDFAAINSQATIGNYVAGGNFSQIRILTMINGQSGHITWKYDANANINYSLDDFNKLKQMYPSIVPGIVQNVFSIDKKSVYVFAVPAYAIHPDGSTHITIKPGNHFPKETGTIVRAINAGKTSVSIPNRSGKQIVYDLTNLKSEQCEIHVLGVFGI